MPRTVFPCSSVPRFPSIFTPTRHFQCMLVAWDPQIQRRPSPSTTVSRTCPHQRATTTTWPAARPGATRLTQVRSAAWALCGEGGGLLHVPGAWSPPRRRSLAGVAPTHRRDPMSPPTISLFPAACWHRPQQLRPALARASAAEQLRPPGREHASDQRCRQQLRPPWAAR